MNQSKGFTLVEMVGVIVIAGVLSVSAGSLLRTDVFDERYLFEDVLSGARYAQKMAMGRGCQVQFSIDANSFELMHDANCSTASAVSFSGSVFRPFSANEQYSNSSFPSGLTVSSATVVFYPQGWACNVTGSNHTTVSITFVGTSSRTLNIECGTGFVYDS